MSSAPRQNPDGSISFKDERYRVEDRGDDLFDVVRARDGVKMGAFRLLEGMRFEAEVSDSPSSWSRGEPVNCVSAKPEGASRPMRASPTWTANGAAAQCREIPNRRAANTRTAVILAAGGIMGFSEAGFGDDSGHAA